MFCTKCGKQLSDDMLFCPACGASTEASKKAVEEAPVKEAEKVQEVAPETPVVEKVQEVAPAVEEKPIEVKVSAEDVVSIMEEVSKVQEKDEYFAAAPATPAPAMAARVVDPKAKPKARVCKIIELVLALFGLGILTAAWLLPFFGWHNALSYLFLTVVNMVKGVVFLIKNNTQLSSIILNVVFSFSGFLIVGGTLISATYYAILFFIKKIKELVGFNGYYEQAVAKGAFIKVVGPQAKLLRRQAKNPALAPLLSFSIIAILLSTLPYVSFAFGFFAKPLAIGMISYIIPLMIAESIVIRILNNVLSKA